MIQKQAQIKINLPTKFKNKVEKRADSYDLTLAGYIKHLMLMDLKARIQFIIYQKGQLKH